MAFCRNRIMGEGIDSTGGKMTRPLVKIHTRTQALPGYFLLEIIQASHGDPVGVEKRVILEWGYEKDDEFSIPYPITFGGVAVDGLFILRPDGVVEDVEGERFASLEEFRQAVRDGDV